MSAVAESGRDCTIRASFFTRTDSINRSIVGCFRFFTLTQYFDLPAW